MDRLWATVRSQNVRTLGINHWYYGPNYELFVGVEVPEDSPIPKDLTMKEIRFDRFIRWKHTGNFSDMHLGYDELKKEIRDNGYQASGSSLEIYGHETGNRRGGDMEILIEITDE